MAIKKGPQFHATPDDRSHFLSAPVVHIGTERAALSRVDPLKWDDDDSAQQQMNHRGMTRLWSVSLRPDAKVGPRITDTMANDIGEAWSGGREHPIHNQGYDAYPYSNEYEDPGSTSFVAKSSALYRSRPVGDVPSRLARQPDYPHDDMKEQIRQAGPLHAVQQAATVMLGGKW